MYKNKTFLAIAPARGGSKRLQKKNILDISGKPLIAWSIEAGLKSKYIDKLVVSSEDSKILNISQEFGAEIIKRPKNLALDNTTSFEVVKHAIESLKNYDYIIMLQPTSPLRDENDIDSAIEFLFKKKADAVISICETDHSPLWTNTLKKNGDLTGFIDNEIINKRSQDLEKFYRLNGAIYICLRDRLLKEKSFFIRNKIYGYIMEKEKSVDIDTEIDFKLAEILLNKKILSVKI